MFIAKKLRKENIAEYLIYMWQVEDLLRALHLDIDEVKSKYLVRFNDLEPQQQKELETWYEQLIDMMRSEGVSQKGHIQLCKNVIINLTEMHQKLMASQQFPYYRTAYNEALPLIVELRTKQGKEDANELESCFELLYGVMLLKMQQTTISDETLQATKKISTFLGMLGDYFLKDEVEPLQL